MWAGACVHATAARAAACLTHLQHICMSHASLNACFWLTTDTTCSHVASPPLIALQAPTRAVPCPAAAPTRSHARVSTRAVCGAMAPAILAPSALAKASLVLMVHAILVVAHALVGSCVRCMARCLTHRPVFM